ncbi:MAG: DUF4124 domain-containing protein [Gammaproteobacteria bacterium]|nr:DUF4124 domain-containing protein [Gammaproteobacteria bacterium]
MKRFLLPIIFIACNSQAAGIQKWIDESGQIHYGDRPPAKVTSEEIKVNRPPSNPGRPLPRLGDEQPDETAGVNPDNIPPGDATSDEQAAEICAQSRKDLQVIQRSTRIRLRQADGSSRYMTAEEIDQRRERSEKDIEEFCR